MYPKGMGKVCPKPRVLPNGRPYFSPKGLWEFQEIGVADAFIKETALAIWDTGLGKTHLAMALTGLCFEQGEIDHVLILAERDKAKEWQEDFQKFTVYDPPMYYGSTDKRARLRANLPPVMISVYETVRNDAMSLEDGYTKESKRPKKIEVAGPLTEVLQNKRVLVVYDEISVKLSGRGSTLFHAHDLMLKAIRKHGHLRTLALTGTPVQNNPEGYYNLGRLLCPERMCTVKDFSKRFIKSHDNFNQPQHYYDGKDGRENRLTELTDMLRPIIMRKRKSDPDVFDFFPKKVEEFVHLEMGDQQAEFYDVITSLFDPPEGQDDQRTEQDRLVDEGQLYVAARQVSGHPAALAKGQSQVAVGVTEQVTEAGLRAIGSVTLERLLRDLQRIVRGQGAQVVVFTFFGQSVLHLIHEALLAAGHLVSINHGQMSVPEKTASRQAFKDGRTNIFLSSDSGARGLNLGCASYLINFEMPLTHSNYEQRSNRHHRIDSEHESVTVISYIVDGTVQEGIAEACMKRNSWSDTLLEDEDAGENFLTADQRRALLQISRGRAKGRAKKS